VTTAAVVIGEIPRQQRLQVRFVQDDDMIEQFSSQRPDHSLDEGVLPGRARGGHHFLNAKCRQATAGGGAVDAVIVAEDVARSVLKRKSFAELLGDPGRMRLFADSEMDDAAAIMPQDEEDVKVAERDGRNCEEVDRGDVPGVISQKVFQVCDDGFRPFGTYLATVDSAISWPRRRSSARIRGTPHSGFSVAIRRIRFWTSRGIFGRPGLPRDFRRQKRRKPCRCQ
jgi:hypothetical protein